MQHRTAHTETTPRLSVDGVGKVFTNGQEQTTVLADISFTVDRGEFLSIVGSSGCGKTTLLRIIAGLETPNSGRISVDHDERTGPANSMVFQEASIFPWMTAFDNAAYGLRLRGVKGGELEDRVGHYLTKVGLAKYRNLYPHQLSGGMKQRCSLARAFANDPAMLLMDEPFAAVDEQTRLVLQRELLTIWEEDHKSVVFITHSINEALALSDRILVMGNSPGRIVDDIKLPFGRPRDPIGMRNHPDYVPLEQRIWAQLSPSSGMGGGD